MNLIRKYAADFACIMLALFLVTVACKSSYLNGKVTGVQQTEKHVDAIIAASQKSRESLREVINLQNEQILVLQKRIRQLQGEE